MSYQASPQSPPSLSPVAAVAPQAPAQAPLRQASQASRGSRGSHGHKAHRGLQGAAGGAIAAADETASDVSVSQGVAADAELLCDQGHSLFSIAVPKTSTCDNCANFYKTEHAYHCSQCLYYLCEECYEEKLNADIAPSLQRLERNLPLIARFYKCRVDSGHAMSPFFRPQPPKSQSQLCIAQEIVPMPAPGTAASAADRDDSPMPIGAAAAAAAAAVATFSYVCTRCNKQRKDMGGLRCASGCPGTEICAQCLCLEAEAETRAVAPDGRFCGIKCTKHRRLVGCSQVEGKKLFFDFKCLLCPYRQRAQQPATPSKHPLRLITLHSKHESKKRRSEFSKKHTRQDSVNVQGQMQNKVLTEGEVVVLCPQPRCRLALCLDCAQFVERQRIAAREADILGQDLPGCHLSLSIEHSREPYRCSVCDIYKVPDETSNRPLVWLSDPKSCFSLCIQCAE
eukprot:m51a1_g9253 hypothetical protein (454) ;mRNA; f:27089-28964